MIRNRRWLMATLLALALPAGAARAQSFAPPAHPAPATPETGTEASANPSADEPLPPDRHAFDPPVAASVRKTSGTVLRGVWLGIEPDGIRFQTEQGGVFTYKNKSVRTIRTLDGKVTYNPGKDDVEQAVAASRLAYPRIVRPAPDATPSPTATAAPGRGTFPAPPGFPRPFGGAAPFGGNPFPTGGGPFPTGGAQQPPSNAQQMLQDSQNRAQQQIAEMHRRQQESANAARQQANRAFEQLREQLDSSPRPRWEAGRQIFEYEYRCRHCGHSFTSANGSLTGTPCPQCHPMQARTEAVAASAQSGSGGSSWNAFRLSRGFGKLAIAAISGLALLGGAIFAASKSSAERPRRRKRRSKSDEYEDY